MSTLTTKAEYIALRLAAKQAVQIRKFINEIEIEVTRDLILFGNNEMSIALTKNVESLHQTKHINVQHHYIKELVNKEELTVK